MTPRQKWRDRMSVMGNTKAELKYLDELGARESKAIETFAKKNPVRRSRSNQIEVWCDVSTLLKVDKEIASRLVQGVKQGKMICTIYDGGKSYPELQGKIDYPLSKPFPFTIKTEKRDAFIGSVLWEIAQLYKQIYDTAKQQPKVGKLQNAMFSKEETANPYGVWGHDITDLCFEIIAINDNRINLYVGS